MLLILGFLAQTIVRPAQIVNPNQVRVVDTPVTTVRTEQISTGTFISSDVPGGSITGVPAGRACDWWFYQITSEGKTQNVKSVECQ